MAKGAVLAAIAGTNETINPVRPTLHLISLVGQNALPHRCLPCIPSLWSGKRRCLLTGVWPVIPHPRVRGHEPLRPVPGPRARRRVSCASCTQREQRAPAAPAAAQRRAGAARRVAAAGRP